MPRRANNVSMNSNEHIFRGTHGPRLGEKGFGPVNAMNHYDKGNQFSHSMKKNTNKYQDDIILFEREAEDPVHAIAHQNRTTHPSLEGRKAQEVLEEHGHNPHAEKTL